MLGVSDMLRVRSRAHGGEARRGKRYESCEQGRGILEACGGYNKCDLVENGGDKVDSCVREVVLLMFVDNTISC
jgi:hypothetical protein